LRFLNLGIGCQKGSNFTYQKRRRSGMTVGIGEAVVGRIVHYYPRINVGIVELTNGEINVGVT
jgi:hypothetical protein